MDPKKCDLAKGKCVPCEGGVPKLAGEELQGKLAQLAEEAPGWNFFDGLPACVDTIEKRFTFENWTEALDFTNKIGVIAEAEGHHPDVKLGWGYVTVSLHTHAIRGLSENDFILATKIDQIPH